MRERCRDTEREKEREDQSAEWLERENRRIEVAEQSIPVQPQLLSHYIQGLQSDHENLGLWSPDTVIFSRPHFPCVLSLSASKTHQPIRSWKRVKITLFLGKEILFLEGGLELKSHKSMQA